MEDVKIPANGLGFPEGPVVGDDGSIVVIEIHNQQSGACFGGRVMRTAYVTLSDTGRLGVLQWPEPGLKLNFN